jgi:rubrerythrin
MSSDTPNLMSFTAERAKPDTMQTLVCSKCGMALYMSDRKLAMPTWKCPSCGTVTRTRS